MSLDKLANILQVDEVNLMHGPRGVAVYVRVDHTWHSTTIANDDMRGHRLESIAKSLSRLADDHSRAGMLRKSQAATFAAMRADEDAAYRVRQNYLASRRQQAFDDQPGQLQVQADDSPLAAPTFPEPAGPAVSEAMPSRFHAIVAELRDL